MSGWNPPPGQGGPPYGGDPGYGQQPGGPYGQQPGAGGPYGPPPGGMPPGGQPPYGAGPPPPPGGPGFGAPPGGPYGPPRRKSSAGLVIGLVGGAFALVVLLVVVFVVVKAGSGKEYNVTAAPSAAGWTRDTSAESRFSGQISQLRSSFNRATNGKVDSVVTAFYKDPSGSSFLSTPTGVMFIGGTGDLGDPDEFVKGFRREATGSNAVVTEVDAGSNGGKGVCGRISMSGNSTAICAWATESSFGEIIPISTSSKSTSEVSSLMRRMRDDLETEK